LDSDEDGYLVDLVCFVYLVGLVHLVSFVQPNKQDEPNKPNKQDRPDQPDRPDRPDRPDKPDEPERPDDAQLILSQLCAPPLIYKRDREGVIRISRVGEPRRSLDKSIL
jgi:hypothetical protein